MEYYRGTKQLLLKLLQKVSLCLVWYFLFPFGVGHHQGCPWSPILFRIFMDRICRHSQTLVIGGQFRWPQMMWSCPVGLVEH